MQTFKRIDRRSALKSVLAALVSLAAWRTRDASAAALDERDPQALTLGYVADAKRVDVKKNPTYQAGQVCANCVLLDGKDGDALRPCKVFPGKEVAASGWCRAWVKRT